MKLVIDLPDWCDERNIYVKAGIELVAYKLLGENKIHVKSSRCNMCGKCCENLPDGFPFPRKANGDCVNLEKSKRGDYGNCKLGLWRPHMCCVGLEQKSKRDYCAIEYEERSIN